MSILRIRSILFSFFDRSHLIFLLIFASVFLQEMKAFVVRAKLMGLEQVVSTVIPEIIPSLGLQLQDKMVTLGTWSIPLHNYSNLTDGESRRRY